MGENNSLYISTLPLFPLFPLPKQTIPMKTIFITGASGCIGHYIVQTLLRESDFHLYLLVRNPDKLQFSWQNNSRITLLQGDLRNIDRFSDVLATVDAAVLVATVWGGLRDTYDINVVKTMRLLELLDPQVCQQVIYFSTASVLDHHHQPLKAAGEYGTEYIRSKYTCLQHLSQLAIAPRIQVLFPTLVLGGDDNHPYSHLSRGFPEITRWISLIRFFRADSSFHFIHAQDIAMIVSYLLQGNKPAATSSYMVLGSLPITLNQAVEETCRYFGKRIYFRIPLTTQLANFLISTLRWVGVKIELSPWDRFCMYNRHFTYENPVHPATFGLPETCSTFADVLQLSTAKPNASLDGDAQTTQKQGKETPR
mgnify:CR=1 FL=1